MASAGDILRAAGEILDAGWSQGATARDADGRIVALFGGTTGDRSRASVNKAAVAFSIYGAVVKASSIGGPCDRPALLWDVLYRCALGADVAHGGTNHLHPIIQYNEQDGRTKAEVLALIDLAALDCDRIGSGPLEPPIKADPKILEQAKVT